MDRPGLEGTQRGHGRGKSPCISGAGAPTALAYSVSGTQEAKHSSVGSFPNIKQSARVLLLCCRVEYVENVCLFINGKNEKIVGWGWDALSAAGQGPDGGRGPLPV